MVHTTELERRMTKGATYWDCFRGVNLRRTEVSLSRPYLPTYLRKPDRMHGMGNPESLRKLFHWIFNLLFPTSRYPHQ